MGDLLSQAEIDALLSNASFGDDSKNEDEEMLAPQEIDALGEIGNICMGTASTSLFTLLGQKVLITTPQVELTTWGEVIAAATNTYVVVRTEFTHGLLGTNMLILKKDDVKSITSLMMGEDGNNTDEDISDLHLSAISEAMNQMMGSAVTSLASMINKRIEISAPKAYKLVEGQNDFLDFDINQKIVKILFKMEIGDMIDSEIMQFLPINFAKEMVAGLLSIEEEPKISAPIPEPEIKSPSQGMQQSAAAVQSVPPMMNQKENPAPINSEPPQKTANQNQIHMTMNSQQAPVNIQPVQYQNFEEGRSSNQKESIGLLMDVPLQVTVELGRTQKLIRDILEFAPGTVIELDKLAGEQVDILVNGKIIAKGEVVIIDESFGVRVTDIVQPSKRL